jgi:hypothetical protein
MYDAFVNEKKRRRKRKERKRKTSLEVNDDVYYLFCKMSMHTFCFKDI